jgi:hypothetical protein
MLGKILATRHSKAMGRFLLTVGQVGVGTSGGVEAVYHATRAFSNTLQADEVIVKLDVRNAFNSVSRGQMVQALKLLAAKQNYDVNDLLAYFEAAYAQPSHIYYQPKGSSVHISSEEGCQQGDPLGPLFFAIVFTLACARAAQALDLPLLGSFLDDAVVGGHVDEVRSFIDNLEVELRSIGLTLNHGKCRAITTHDSNPFADKGFQLEHYHSWHFVGAPIGNYEHILSFCANKVNQVSKKLSLFSLLPPHLSILMAKFCGTAPLLSYWVRVLGPLETWEQADKLTSTFFQRIVGPVFEPSRPLIHLPCRVGGFGLKSIGGLIGHAALAASCLETADIASSILIGDEPFFGERANFSIEALRDAGVVTDVGRPTKRIQKFFSKQLVKPIVDSLPQPIKDTARRWNSALGSAPLNPVFSLLEAFELKDQEFVFWARLRLGADLAESTQKCVLCQSTADQKGNHTLSCMGSNDKYEWHKLITAVIIRLASTACWAPTPEPHPFPQDPGRRLDIALQPGTVSLEKVTLIDVSITHASTCAAVSEKKRSKYGHQLLPDQQLLPVVFETSGGCEKPTMQFLQALAKGALTRGWVLGGRAAPTLMVGSTLARCVAQRLTKQFVGTPPSQ